MSENANIVPPRGGRVYYLDAVRALATIFVVISHTHYLFFSFDDHSISLSFFKVVGIMGVPFFVMLTGYFMLHRDYENEAYLTKYLSRNVFSLLMAYEFWNIAWNVLRYTEVAEEPQPWINIAKAALFMGDTNSALWYLPMAIALYLGMPVIAVAYNKIKHPMYCAVFVIALVFSGTIIPTIDILFAFTDEVEDFHSVLKMNVFGASVWGESVWMIYLFAGYAVYKGKLKNISTVLLAFAGVIIPLAIMCLMTYNGYVLEKNHHSFILLVLLAVCAFELITRTENLLRTGAYLRFIVDKICSVSFAIYTMHIFIGGAFFKCWESYGMTIPMGKEFSFWTASIFYIGFILAIIICAYLIAHIFKRNSLIKRYILLMK